MKKRYIAVMTAFLMTAMMLMGCGGNGDKAQAEGTAEVSEGAASAAGTDQEAEQTKNLIAELEMDIMPLDGLIAFAGSEAGAKVFGPEKAKEVEAHGQELKEAGKKYCDCPACAAAEAILEKKEQML